MSQKTMQHLKIIPQFLNDHQIDALWQELVSLPLVSDPIKLFGKEYLIPRKHLFMGDEGLKYSYSNIQMKTWVWTPKVYEVLLQVNEYCNHTYNSVLINLYEDGQDSNGWHSDNEKELGFNPQLFSLSLGAERAFNIREKGQSKMLDKLVLENGMGLWMQSGFQEKYEHSIPKTAKRIGPRLNLTFRKIVK